MTTRSAGGALGIMKLFGLAGWSGSGKTVLMRALIPELTKLGVSVSTLKHAHHAFDVDHPGKDSYEHRAAGAQEVLIASRARYALMHELRGAEEPDLPDLVAKLSPVDLVLVEGWKFHTHPKLEVYRPDHRNEQSRKMLWPEDPTIVAVSCPVALPGLERPRFDPEDTAVIARFILSHLGLGE